MSTEQAIKTEEQIPLTATTETPAETTTEAAAVVAPEEPKPKKNWFKWGTKKGAAAVDEANVEEGAATGDAEEKPLKEKKMGWWSKCKTKKCEDEQKEDHIAIGMDFVNRDHNGLNNHVQHNFDDIFGEADSQHTWEFMWRLNASVFNWVRLFVYRFFTILALPFTLLFAIFFGFFAAVNVFVIVPLGKLVSIPGNILAKLWNWLVHAVFDPVASAVGLIFSNFNIRKYGINQETTAPCV
ncbi:hypothetical protein B9Z55_012923 [Caenorhabditis nigoni]|uniref:Caveolin n=1 Tax=Caenorhabditis nigoni TaxID=1611254 RepID=A0A2G5TZJ0_9PELO|nr:hypothetical protein B9Z55_012923 [Caenorhabditis nigoni]